MISKKIFSFPVIAAAAVIWSACGVSKNNQAPALALPPSFDSTAVTYDTTSIATIPWQTFFTDATLQQLIKRGIENNFDLQIAVKNIETAQQQLLQARAAFGPTVNGQVSAQISRPSDNSLNGKSASTFLGKAHIEDYTVGLNLAWEADIWGKIRQQKAVALASYLKTAEAAKAVQTGLVATIAQGYYNLLMLEEQLDIARKNLDLANRVLAITKLQRDAGEVTTLAVEQATAQQQSTALLIPQLEQARTIQEHALRLLTGDLPQTIAHTNNFATLPVADTFSTGVPARLVQMRPDVRAAELQLKAATAQIGVAQASMYPALNITAGGGLNSFKASNWFNIPGSLFGLASGAILQPILQKRELKTQLETAKIGRETAVIQFRQSVYTAVTEVSDAVVKINQLKSQAQITKARTDTLQHAISNAELLFKSGMASYLEVITAQTNSLQSELSLADIKRQQLSAVVELYRALGGGQL
ncbi:efflux transporter outer membrane subunit [Deminuibacter soli]|uniref:TolC family protein n=1 Tax=Deminuibacter soli TaxID=2291815 RepID=A0A3E1NMM1_9BACT|nr:efflux transporter outer membrane subunit [Deminuibacter soli]RFM29161.1 TolC family protein [Deminuibacter soli]